MSNELETVQSEETISVESDAPGTVVVGVEVRAPVDVVWRSLTDSAVVASWFGDLSRELTPGGSSRLDFGDGDFFDIEAVKIDAPEALQYRWRFLGIGPQDTVTWRLEPAGNSCRVTVTDSEPERSHEAAMMLREGWLDFTSRLVEFHATGKSARYDWRRELDVGVDIPGACAETLPTLSTPEAQSHYLPFEAPLRSGATAEISDGMQPGLFSISDVQWQSRNEVEFKLSGDGWIAPTVCRIDLIPRLKGLLLNVSHNGWERISPDPAIQLQQRRRFCEHWIAALKRARQTFVQTANAPSHIG
jgi:uncharacterized protein YndB with AHSA1/START domain